MKQTLALIVCELVLFPFFLRAADEGVYSPESLPQGLKGNVVQISEYSGTSLTALSLKRTIVFDKRKQPVSEVAYDTAGQVKNETKFVYNDAGLIAEIQGLGSDGLIKWKYAYAYDEHNRLLEETSYDSQGQLEWKDRRRYNEEGLLIETIKFNSTGSVNLQDTYQYDDKRRLNLRLTLYSDGKLLKRVVLFYNEKDQIFKEERYNANGFYEQVEYSYNDKNQQVTAKTFAADGILKGSTVRTYDAGGNILQEITLAANNTTRSTTSFIYDDKGNWVRKREGAELFFLREISYGQQ